MSESETPVKQASSTPELWEKVVTGLPILLLYLPVGMLAQTGVRSSEVMFREMDIGELPALTNVLIFFARCGLYHPLTMVLGFLVVALVHFMWAGKTYQRLFWFDMVTVYTLTGFLWISMLGFMLPMVVIMERLGR
jgi:hypothetical protein